MQTVTSEPIELDDGYVLVNTEMLMGLLAEGKSVFLPELSEFPDNVSGYSDEDVELYQRAMKVSEIESVVYVGEEEVQCIEIDDDQHLYLTDGFIASHNTSNIVFLKSTDDAMLDTLEKMGGKRHVVRTQSKQITKDVDRIWMKNKGEINYTMSVNEEPVVTYNDLAFLSERNSIVFRAGDPVVWNRNETILPMSWRLFSNKIVHPGHDYSLQTIPTLSSAIDFDVRKNQPDFIKMLNKRLEQAKRAKKAMKLYQETFGYSDYEIEQLDPDTYSDVVVDLINAQIREEAEAPVQGKEMYDASYIEKSIAEAVPNEEQMAANREAQRRVERFSEKKFAGGTLAPEAFVTANGVVVGQGFERNIVQCFVKRRNYFAKDSANFIVKDFCLWSTETDEAGNNICFIMRRDESLGAKKLNEAAHEVDTTVYSEEDMEITEEIMDEAGTYHVTDEFYRFLAECDRWDFAGGEFEKWMKNVMAEETAA